MAKIKESPPKVYNEAEKILKKYNCTYIRKSKDPFIIVTGCLTYLQLNVMLAELKTLNGYCLVDGKIKIPNK